MADTSSQKGNHIETLLSKKILMMGGEHFAGNHRCPCLDLSTCENTKVCTLHCRRYAYRRLNRLLAKSNDLPKET